MADKNLQNFLFAALGIFVFFIFTLFCSVMYGETTWIRILIPLGIALVTISIASWLRRLTK